MVAEATDDGSIVCRHVRYAPPQVGGAQSEPETHPLSASDLLTTAMLLRFEASRMDIVMHPALRASIMRRSVKELAEERLAAMTPPGRRVFQAIRDNVPIPHPSSFKTADHADNILTAGTYLGLGRADTLPAAMRSATSTASSTLSPATGINMVYVGRSLERIKCRIDHHKRTAAARKKQEGMYGLHYKTRNEATAWCYIAASCRTAKSPNDRNEQIVLFELFDARFVGAWMGDAADSHRLALVHSGRRFFAPGLNGTPVRDGFKSYKKASVHVADTMNSVFDQFVTGSPNKSGADTAEPWRTFEGEQLRKGMWARMHKHGSYKIHLFNHWMTPPQELSQYLFEGEPVGTNLLVLVHAEYQLPADGAISSFHSLDAGEQEKMAGVTLTLSRPGRPAKIWFKQQRNLDGGTRGLVDVIHAGNPARSDAEIRAQTARDTAVARPFKIGHNDAQADLKRGVNAMLAGSAIQTSS
ncbi:hypothetical protein CF319_g9141 [Tilletia indica]|nr:hypothetical protein CF319_g9141 [Tilletia indica]